MQEDHEVHLIRSDISELKGNVNSIKQEIAEMRKTVSEAMTKMTDAIVSLAVLTERLHTNVEEHKILHQRIDDTKTTLQDHHSELEDLKDQIQEQKMAHVALATAHANCQIEKKNSLFNKAKGKMVELMVVIFTVLMLLLIAKNSQDLLKLFLGFK